jgi:hypothetical protein
MNIRQNKRIASMVGYSVNILGERSGNGVNEMPSRNFPVWTVGIYDESQDSLCPGRGLNRIPTEYE